MSTLVDLVKIFVASTGTGPITFGSAVPGYRGVEALTNNAVYSYSIQQLSQWEYGSGQWVSSQFVRTPTASSNGGSPIVVVIGSWVSFTMLSGDITSGAVNIVNTLGNSTNLATSQQIVTSSLTQKTNVADLAASSGGTLVGVQLSATAAVPRTQQDRNGDTVNAKDFGAKFDGVTDDTTALQAGLNYLQSIGGGTLDLPAGASKVQTLTRPDSVTIRGRDRQGTILVSPSGFNAPLIQSIGSLSAAVNRGGVQSLTLFGSGITNSGMVGIRESYTNRASHRDLVIFGMYEGMYVENGWQNAWTNIQVHGAGTNQSRTGFRLGPKDPTAGVSNAVIAVGCMAQDVSYCGWRLENYDGSKFTACEGTNGSYGWYLGAPSTGTQPCQFGHFVNCLGDTNSVNGWRIDKGNASDIRQAQFSNCWSGSSGVEGVYVAGASQLVFSNWQIVAPVDHGMSIQLASRIAITGCHIRDYSTTASRNGICINNSTAISATGNQIYTSKSGSGTSIQEYGTSDYSLITGNMALGTPTLIGSHSIQANNINV